MSICRYCGHDVVWIKRPNTEAFFPPFEDSEALGRLDYEVAWDSETGDWRATPADRSLTVKLAPHRCEARLQKIQQERAERDARHERVMRALAAGEAESIEPEPAPELRIEYIEKWRDPPPEAYLKIARRLALPCPTCGAAPLDWCTYKAEGGQTSQLHVKRHPPREDG